MPNIRARSLMLLAVAHVLAACASITSTTTIEPGTSFKLGGGQAGAFIVRGRNAGPVAVSVFSEVGGKRDSLLTLGPGASVDSRFPATAMAVFRNTSSTTAAVVAIKVTGDVSALGMRYEANRKR